MPGPGPFAECTSSISPCPQFDTSPVALDRWQSLSDAECSGFAPLCPDLVVELASPSYAGPRGLTALRQKMAAYQGNGARHGWLLIPAERAVELEEI